MRGRMEGNEVEGREYEVVKPLVSPSRTWGLHRESLEGFEQEPDMIRLACYKTALSALRWLQGQEIGEVGRSHTGLLSFPRALVNNIMINPQFCRLQF